MGDRAERVGGFEALRRGLCPVCRSARIFTGRWRMNETCPACHTRFERAPGYFVGAMYISYAFAVIMLVVMVVIFELGVLRSLPTGLAAGIVVLAYLLMVPAIFRWSRILWIHLGERVGW